MNSSKKNNILFFLFSNVSLISINNLQKGRIFSLIKFDNSKKSHSSSHLKINLNKYLFIKILNLFVIFSKIKMFLDSRNFLIITKGEFAKINL